MFKKLFSFKGRATRKEFWKMQAILFVTYILFGITLGILAAVIAPKIPENELPTYLPLFGFLTLIFIIPLGIINWAVIVRRLHDLNLSGWYSLILLPISFLDKSGILSLICIISLGSIPSTSKETKWDISNDY